MPFIRPTGIKQGSSELCVIYPEWSKDRDVIEVGRFGSKTPLVETGV